MCVNNLSKVALDSAAVGIKPATFRLRNDLYCVEWGVKLYSLTHFSSQVQLTP